MVLPCWIIKSTATHLENASYSIFTQEQLLEHSSELLHNTLHFFALTFFLGVLENFAFYYVTLPSAENL